MDRFHPKSGTLEMIVGCMFSGKSSELIQRIRLHRIIGHEVMVVNHVSNKRYAEDAGGAVSSHDHDHLRQGPRAGVVFFRLGSTSGGKTSRSCFGGLWAPICSVINRRTCDYWTGPSWH